MFGWLKSSNYFLKKVLSVGTVGGFWFLGLGAGGWLLQGTIAPTPVHAATERLNITVTRQPSETFQSMLRRAEAAARAAAQRSFDRDVLVTDVAVSAIGQSGGAITPMFTLEVNRQNWRTSPNPERWATYYSDAQSLLNLTPRTATTTAPATATPITTPAPSSSPSPRTRPVAGNQPLANPATPPAAPADLPANGRPEDEVVVF